MVYFQWFQPRFSTTHIVFEFFDCEQTGRNANLTADKKERDNGPCLPVPPCLRQVAGNVRSAGMCHLYRMRFSPGGGIKEREGVILAEGFRERPFRVDSK